jgi:Flp pilus assembly protein TadD
MRHDAESLTADTASSDHLRDGPASTEPRAYPAGCVSRGNRRRFVWWCGMKKKSYVLRRTALGIACAFVVLAWTAPAHGDSTSSYKKQVAGGPTAQAIGAAVDALDAGDLKRAEIASLKALALAPDEPHALALLAEVEMRQGHQANALKYLQTAVAKNPKSAVAEEAMGRYLDENKEYAGAESAFKKAIALDPTWAAAQIALGDFYLKQGKSAPALAAYREAVAGDPKNGAAHLALGLGMAAAGDGQNSEKELRMAAGLTPNSARPHVALGNLLSLKGQDGEAISEYQTALKLDPRNAGTYVLLGMAQKKSGHSELAEKAYRQALEIDPKNFVALTNLAWIAMMSPGRAGEALGYAKKAAAEAPRLGQVLDALGWAYHVNGENEMASQALKRGVAVAPEDPRILYHLAVVYGAQGHKQEEQATLRKALATNKPFPEMDDAKSRLASKGVS